MPAMDREAWAENDRKVEEAIAKRYDSMQKVAEDLQLVGREMVANWSGRPLKQESVDILIAGEGARATKTYSAVVELLRRGYGPQAAMLNRALFEGTVTAHWASANADEARDLFLKHARHNELLWLEAFGKVGWLDEDEEEPAPDERAEEADEEAQREREELDKLFGPAGHRSWTRRSLWTLVNEIAPTWPDVGQQLWKHYRIAHRASNQTLHATHDALLGPATADDDALVFDMAPSARHIDRGYVSSYWTYLQTLTLLRDHFNLDTCREDLDRLVNLPIEEFR